MYHETCKVTLVHYGVGDTYNRGEKIDISKFVTDPGLPIMVSSEVATSQNGEAKCSTYRCKKCRRIVAQQENVMDHVPGEGESSFSWHKRKSGNPFDKYEEECSSIFVEPLKWMTAGNIPYNLILSVLMASGPYA